MRINKYVNTLLKYKYIQFSNDCMLELLPTEKYTFFKDKAFYFSPQTYFNNETVIFKDFPFWF